MSARFFAALQRAKRALSWYNRYLLLTVGEFGSKIIMIIYTQGCYIMKEIKVPASVDQIDIVTDFVNEALDALLCPIKYRMQIDVAIDELFGNIARYAYHPEKGDAIVQVESDSDGLSVTITFIDSGKPFDPLGRDDPDITLSADERSIGGLGIFVVKKTMDGIDYEYKDGHNILRIKKNLNR